MAQTERKSKSPYQRHHKREIEYSNVPLYSGRGAAYTGENIRRWEDSIKARYGFHPKEARTLGRPLAA